MAGNTVEITDGNFEEAVLNSDTPIVVDFWAEWCGPCKQIAPVLEELATEHADTYKIGKLNVDESRENAMQYGIRSIPTMLVFKNGQVGETIVGALPKAQIHSKITAAL